MKKMRIKKLTLDDRKAILSLRKNKFSVKYLAELFSVSKGRISQLGHDTYKESEFLGETDAEE